MRDCKEREEECGGLNNLKTCQGHIVKFKSHFNEPNHSLFYSFSFSAPLPPFLFSSPGRSPFESTNKGPSSRRHWNVNEASSACSWRSESPGLFIELPKPRAWLGGGGARWRITQRGRGIAVKRASPLRPPPPKKKGGGGGGGVEAGGGGLI